jgi:pyruvate-ferredoxin/flavodoxin oxidoreductase
VARQMKTMDGNTAAAHVSYAFTEVAAIYPITPSSNMAEYTDEWAAAGRKNLFGQPVKVTEMQSEAGAAGAVHGSLAAGALTTTYTASQGLLLMIPNMYKMAGELLPAVIDVSARAVAGHALSIFGDHSDIYACRQTGFAFLGSSNVQEVMDLGAVAHLSAIKGRVPFVHFFDGFRTSHEIQKIEVWDDEDLAEMLDWDAVEAFRKRSLNPERPVLRGTAQNPDIFFQAKEAANPYYDALPGVVEDYMAQVNAKIGTNYQLFNYYGAPDADRVIIAMGSVCDTAEEVIDKLTASGEKVGLIKVRLYRPFCADRLIAAIPDSVKSISVLDRTKEPGSVGEPLYLDVALALRNSKFKDIPIYSGRYGLGSKDTVPGQIAAVYQNAASDAPKPRFTIGINDDVTYLSLETIDLDTSPEGTTSCKFWGLGSDGTVGANKNSIKIIGDHTDMYAQAYFSYDSKKSGGITVSHLRFGKNPIKSTYLISKADFVACHNQSYVNKYDMVSDVKPGGAFLLNTAWTVEELDEHLPGDVKRTIAENNIRFYTVDAVGIAREIGLGGRINTILQSAFFKLANIIPIEDAIRYMKEAATASYGRFGDNVVKMNHEAIDRGVSGIVEVKIPESWKNASGSISYPKAEEGSPELRRFVDEILTPMNAQKGDELPVSAFVDAADGTFPQGTSAYEKRGIAVDVPEWLPENCIQCNFCSYVCPHAVIRPVPLNETDAATMPEGTKMVDMVGMPGYKFAVTISPLDCTGCGNCVAVCPGRKGEKALALQPLESQMAEQAVFNKGVKVRRYPEVLAKFKETTVKGSQFKEPLLQFSGACAGCGETPYAKLVTQLFGDRMYIANATGCSSIWGGSAPSTPYSVGQDGRGPSWANSLFEDNAEYGYGMSVAQNVLRARLIEKIEQLNAMTKKDYIREATDKYLATKDNSAQNRVATDELVAALERSAAEGCPTCVEILKSKEYLAKKSVWIFGGDGWAYDIGFGGLDHVIASGEDVNILVFDTEVYSNTGGQSSKSTPIGAVAQFAAAGKEIGKKSLAEIAMTYGYVYVAQVGMGADYNQCVKAMVEAESYNGPSIIIAYAPCINHGIKGGMGLAQARIKSAVESGYWHTFRYDPRLTAEGKNPFTMDSKAPSTSYLDFIQGEARYTSLKRSFPERADMLFERAAAGARAKYDHLLQLSKLYAQD